MKRKEHLLNTTIAAIGLFIVCFLLGSVPWGLVISKVFYGKDLRDEGSGNIGTTNAIRSMGKVGGYAVFVLDFGKGLLSGWIATLVAGWCANGGPVDTGFLQLCLAISFLGCVWGHIFSPWLGFKGGKGIAVAIGCLFMVFGPIGAILELAIFIVLVPLTRYVSVGSIASAAACPFFALYFFWGNWPAWAIVSIGALTVVWAHRENIARLRAGTERKLGEKK